VSAAGSRDSTGPPLLVWDFDGTVADSFALIRAAAATALAAHRLPAPDETLLRSLVGLSLETTFRRLLPGDVPDDRLLASLAASYRAAAGDLAAGRVTLYPGIDLLLGDLAAAGTVSAIATSKSRVGVLPLLDQLGVAGRFAAVITHDDVAEGRGKPDPQMVVLACDALGREPADAVVIGDTAFDAPSDAERARRERMKRED